MFNLFLKYRAQRKLTQDVQDVQEAVHKLSLQVRQMREHLELTAGQLNKVRGMVTGGLHSVANRETGGAGSVPFGDKEGLRRVAGLTPKKPQA
jgi:hypothetical protein